MLLGEVVEGGEVIPVAFQASGGGFLAVGSQLGAVLLTPAGAILAGGRFVQLVQRCPRLGPQALGELVQDVDGAVVLMPTSA